MKAISDATPIIHLAKIGKIVYLKKIFEEVIIEKEVYKEIIENKKSLDKVEAEAVKRAINESIIKVKEVKEDLEIPNLDIGEKKSILLAKELKINNILIDEKEGFNAAIVFGLTPLRTTSILMFLLDKKIIDFKEYEISLNNLIRTGYYLDSTTHQRLINIGKNL